MERALTFFFLFGLLLRELGFSPPFPNSLFLGERARALLETQGRPFLL
jgi:hypothetical protein